jgi:hypothetical protein
MKTVMNACRNESKFQCGTLLFELVLSFSGSKYGTGLLSSSNLKLFEKSSRPIIVYIKIKRRRRVVKEEILVMEFYMVTRK